MDLLKSLLHLPFIKGELEIGVFIKFCFLCLMIYAINNQNLITYHNKEPV